MCTQFENKTIKARNEYLCSLEDVLASIQPSTFVDEQLSRYKGMLWSELLYETAARRSASSEHLGELSRDSLQCLSDAPTTSMDAMIRSVAHEELELQQRQQAERAANAQKPRNASMFVSSSNFPATRDSLKIKISKSTGLASDSGSCQPPQQQQPQGAVKSPLASPGKRAAGVLREKPKLKRGQTVDSVFRIPLIPSSPLKHAQVHQQTPTAHLEKRLNTIEDDERQSSPSLDSATLDNSTAERKNSDSPSRARSRSVRLNSKSRHKHHSIVTEDSAGEVHAFNDSSLEWDDERAFADGRIARQASLSTLSSTVTRAEQKRQRALWDLFQSECVFFFDHLMTLKNVYMEPLKKIQVDGFAMFADPDVLFGNLDELCCGVYDFCKEFLYIIMRTLKTRPEELNATDVLIKLYKKNTKIDHLRGVYHRYTLNYINALTYLESLRRQVEFVEFERVSIAKQIPLRFECHSTEYLIC